MIPPLLALFAWIPISLLFFRRLPIRVALLINFVGGWAILPAANYVDSGEPMPYHILGTSLASNYFLTKAVIVGFSGLLAIFIFDRTRFLRFRLTVWDLPMGMWLIAPLLSAIANDSILNGLIGFLYQLLAWGSPYLIGRLYFTDTQSLRLAAKAFVIGGFAYIPFCIFEIFKGPWIYHWLYGYQPFQMLGAERYFGLYRPIGLLENGNQLGIWMATSTLIAVWLWARKTASSIFGIPILIVAIGLFVVTILCQSTGAILLLLALVPFVFVDPRHLSRTVSIVLVVGILGFAATRIANFDAVKDFFTQNSTVIAAQNYLKSIGKGSLEWRMQQDDHSMKEALSLPILGHGEWDWWSGGVGRPWGLWLLTFGMYGSVGLVSLEALLLIPALRAVWFPLARSDIGYTNMRHTLSAAVLISAVDSLLNSAIILPLMLVIGGMTIWSTLDTEVEVEYNKSKASAGSDGWRGSQNPKQKVAR